MFLFKPTVIEGVIRQVSNLRGNFKSQTTAQLLFKICGLKLCFIIPRLKQYAVVDVPRASIWKNVSRSYR